jgi:hypothetical protein
MVYIIIGIIVIGIIAWLADKVGGMLPLIIIIGLIIILSVFGLWPYALGFAAICAVGYGIVMALGKAGKYVGNQVEQHDKLKKETAQIAKKTQDDKLMHNNDAALMEELSKNCYWLGYMSDDMWLQKLPNYANRQYSTDFRTITNNFAKQIEQQHIIQNNDWFEPFKLYVLNHPGGSTVTKMLHEVNCPQLKMTHATPDGDLVNTWLVRGTQKANKDVPALFSSTFIKDMNESVFTPTPYLQKLYGESDEKVQEANHATEINFDDL